MSNFCLPFDIKGKNVLLAAIGGGHDALGSIPLMLKLDIDNNVFISSFNIDSDNAFEESLSKHIKKPVEVFKRGGVAPLQRQYTEYVNDKKIDVIIGVDGGVDSLMKGDEENGGTLLDDLISIAALANTPVKQKYLACLGFSTETEEELDHFAVLSNMADLFKQRAFIGATAISNLMPEFNLYKDTCESVWGDLDRKSHIQTKVISCVMGGFGSHGNHYKGVDAKVHRATPKVMVNPLMSLYWFFDMDIVYNSNDLCKKLHAYKTNTNTDNLMVYRNFKKLRPKGNLGML